MAIADNKIGPQAFSARAAADGLVLERGRVVFRVRVGRCQSSPDKGQMCGGCSMGCGVVMVS
jgi:hypothetical protein